MDLTKLFAAQKVLMERIEKEHPLLPGEDRFNKRILALLVEVGECANEWRGFKFWSKNQGARLKAARGPYMNLEDADFYNPLLEEYVDGLHFVLEIGLECENLDLDYPFENYLEYNSRIYSMSDDANDQFPAVFNAIIAFGQDSCQEFYDELIFSFFGLGSVLGFTWEEIEQAYFDKMEINHKRQSEGY